MKLKINKFLIPISILLAIICCIIVTLSPRFGRCIMGLNNTNSECSYRLDYSWSRDDVNYDAYVDSHQDVITISYSTRFLGDITVRVDDDKSVTIEDMHIDGGYSLETQNGELNSQDYAKFDYSAYSIISNDAGGFFFVQYLQPIFFVVLSAFFMKFSFKTKSNKFELTLHFLAVASCVFAFLFAFRIC